MDNSSKNFIVIILSATLLFVIIFGAGFFIKGKIQEREALSFQNGTIQGAIQTLNSLVNYLSNCPKEGFPLEINNRTIHIIIAECYQIPPKTVPSEIG